MKTSFFARAGRLCRIAAITMIVITSINAKILKTPIEPFTIKDDKQIEPSSQLMGFRSESSHNKKVILKWNMTNPEFYTYTIEKSRDGENFTAIQSNGIQQDKDNGFSWTDHYPKATNCYRIRLSDANGKNSYSKTLVVETFKSGDVEMVGATPQVSINDIQVDVQMKESGIVNLNITNEKGEIVMQQKEKSKAGYNQFMFSGSRDLKPGGYFLKVVVNGTDRMLVHLVKS
jgi:hypothetical protein